MKNTLHRQLRLSDLGSGPMLNRAALRRALIWYYMRKPGRSLETWFRNIQNYSHPRRYNLVFRSFIRNRVGLPLDVSEESIPPKIRDYVFKYYPLVERNRVHDKAVF